LARVVFYVVKKMTPEILRCHFVFYKVANLRLRLLRLRLLLQPFLLLQ
jgi:hypothetical protein